MLFASGYTFGEVNVKLFYIPAKEGIYSKKKDFASYESKHLFRKGFSVREREQEVTRPLLKRSYSNRIDHHENIPM